MVGATTPFLRVSGHVGSGEVSEKLKWESQCSSEEWGAIGDIHAGRKELFIPEVVYSINLIVIIQSRLTFG